MKLSPEQQRAVEREGQDVCVVAGPGSGKTRVLTERFAWLIEQRNVEPSRILAITFTEKAAIEIKQRLVKRFTASPDLRESVERAWVSTIHGFCTRLLKENAIAAGLSPDFAVLEQSAAERLQREAAEEALDALFTERSVEMRRLLEAIDLSTSDDGRQDDLAASLLKIYEAMRVSGTSEIPERPPAINVWPDAIVAARALLSTTEAPWAARFIALPQGGVTKEHLATITEFHPNLVKVRHPEAKRLRDVIKPQLLAQWLGEWYGELPALLGLAIKRIDVAYRALKRKESAVDFSDLEEFAVELLKSNPDVRTETVGRFDEVLMDELQDTNRVQWELVELVKSRLYAVGDINQSIYGFRHADPAVFAEYRDGLLQAGFSVDELRDNYRSRKGILDVVTHMLDGEPGIEHRALNAEGDFPDKPGPTVERFVATGDQGPEIEGAMVAARIREWSDSGEFNYGDVAILVRTLAAAEPFEEALERAGIPFLLSGGRGFLEARETRDLLAFLAALVNVCDEIPLVGVLRGPLMGLSDAEIYRLGREGWRRVFEERFGHIRQLAGLIPPDRLIAQAFDECGYVATLSERAQANIDKLLAWLRREYRNRPRPLAELLEDLEALREAQTIADAPPPEAGNVVRIMTIHAAKGLEFPAVFVSALHKGPERRTPALLFSRDLGLGAKWLNPASGKGVPDAAHAQLKDRESAREKAEASRLLYVAMTRAEHRLILTHADRKQKSAWEKLASSALPNPETAAEPPPIPRSENEIAAPSEHHLAPPALSGQYDSTATITSIALFHACPRKYYLSRYLGLEPEPDGEGTGAIATGLAVHAALAGQTIDSPEAQRLAEKFPASDWGQRAARASRVEREFDFLFEIDDVILRGQIDLWFEESGELVLIDYKTDRDETTAENYALQLQLYALALERYAGRIPDRAILYYVRSDRAVEISLSAEDLRNAEKRVRDFREAQEEKEFPLRPGGQCKKCAFFGGLCPEGREELVTAGRIFGLPSSFLTPPSSGS
ncbi:MAG: UvrD-helicase domain-containing protein [Bryobacteraceae bacterium]